MQSANPMQAQAPEITAVGSTVTVFGPAGEIGTLDGFPGTSALDRGDRYQKTIVFCVDEEHAALMRQALVNENAELARANPRYIMRITGSDGEGQAQLDNFIDPESTWPVIVTTSKLLSTDAQIRLRP
jgi:hypothetical protein